MLFNSSLLAAGACLVSSVAAHMGVSNYSAVAYINNGAGINGTVTWFQQAHDKSTRVHAEIYGLPQGNHGFHIHSLGNLTGGCASSGSHYNPFNMTHGGPTDKIRHVGDMGNLYSNGPSEAAVLDLDDVFIPLVGPFSVVGRTVVLHADEDDLGKGNASDSKTTGHAGDRIACAIIGQAQ
ncbi:copper/zinc superoxide dismutase [Gongronella butleri]|nr:copper/zinc superoxide dismutase [Gongronella butleri]